MEMTANVRLYALTSPTGQGFSPVAGTLPVWLLALCDTGSLIRILTLVGEIGVLEGVRVGLEVFTYE